MFIILWVFHYCTTYYTLHKIHLDRVRHCWLFLSLTRRIRWSFSDSVQHFHVSDVVNVKRLLQTHDQPLQRNHKTSALLSKAKPYWTIIHYLTMHICPDRQTDVSVSTSSYLSVELDGQYGVGIGVVADLSSLLEVTYFELPGGLEADDGHQATGEQTLHDTHILCVRCRSTHTNKHTH